MNTDNVTLTRTRTVMDLLNDPLPDAGAVAPTFVSVDDDDPSRIRRSVHIEYQAWLDMGSPRQITVTIEPGDQLTPELQP